MTSAIWRADEIADDSLSPWTELVMLSFRIELFPAQRTTVNYGSRDSGGAAVARLPTGSFGNKLSRASGFNVY
jgi:hypothetical protein